MVMRLTHRMNRSIWINALRWYSEENPTYKWQDLLEYYDSAYPNLWNLWAETSKKIDQSVIKEKVQKMAKAQGSAKPSQASWNSLLGIAAADQVNVVKAVIQGTSEGLQEAGQVVVKSVSFGAGVALVVGLAFLIYQSGIWKKYKK